MLLGETLALDSYERFLQPDECQAILSAMREYIAALPPDRTSETQRSRSVHTVPGVSLEETMLKYEPKGRLEIDTVPVEVEHILERATERALPALRRVYPSARRGGSWIYLEYREGQFVTPHIDGTDGPSPRQRNVAGVGISLSDDYEGGEFVVSTSSDPRLWREDDPNQIADGADYTSDWFQRLQPTAWVCRPSVGTALFYGTKLIHSTRPVRSGIVKKMIGFLLG